METLHHDFLTLHRSCLQFKANFLDSQSNVVVNQNKLRDNKQKSHQELSENTDNVQDSFTAQISERFDYIKEADAKNGGKT